MDVLYYYIYLFYAKVMPDDYPHLNTVWALGVTSAFIINFSLDMGLAFFFGYTKCFSNGKYNGTSNPFVLL